jgi:hypothetical protein
LFHFCTKLINKKQKHISSFSKCWSLSFSKLCQFSVYKHNEDEGGWNVFRYKRKKERGKGGGRDIEREREGERLYHQSR